MRMNESRTLLSRMKSSPARGFRLSYVSLSLISLLALMVAGGCKKSESSQGATGPTVDVFKLSQAFPTPTAEVHRSLDTIQFSIRYGNYDAALSELNKLSNDASLTGAQKKAVSDTIEQVKQAQATPPAAPAPAQ